MYKNDARLWHFPLEMNYSLPAFEMLQGNLHKLGVSLCVNTILWQTQMSNMPYLGTPTSMVHVFWCILLFSSKYHFFFQLEFFQDNLFWLTYSSYHYSSIIIFKVKSTVRQSPVLNAVFFVRYHIWYTKMATRHDLGNLL